MRHRTRGALALGAGLMLALLAVFGVLAQTGDPGSKLLSGQEVVIPAGTTIDHDIYVIGNTVTIAGTVNGDVVAAGARVVITGTVTGDVLAAGSEVTVGGTVGGDVRLAAARVTITGAIAEDLALFSSTFVLDAQGRIGQDLLFRATSAVVDGNITGGISGSATDYERHGTVGGPEQVSLTTLADQPPVDRTAALALDALRQYILVVLFGLAMLRFAPGVLRGSAQRVRSQPLLVAGVGVLALMGYVAVLIALVVLMALVSLAFGLLNFGGFVAIDIVATLLAAFGLTFGLIVFSAFIVDAIVGLAIGRLISIADSSRWADIIRLLIGSALVVVVTSFPDVGGLVKLLVILVGLGAFCTHIWETRRPQPAVVPIAPIAV